jgi:DNA uptake protein ComE-like DNA-binding protein
MDQARAADAVATSAPPASVRKVRVVYPILDGSSTELQAPARDDHPEVVAVPAGPVIAATSTQSAAGESAATAAVPDLWASDPKPASAEVEPVSAIASDADDAAREGAVDINVASVEMLDHIDGAGRIGRAIARHRPYRSVEDLVRKRVIRKDVFERIKGQLAAN